MITNCPICKTKLDGSPKFCPECGYKLLDITPNENSIPKNESEDIYFTPIQKTKKGLKFFIIGIMLVLFVIGGIIILAILNNDSQQIITDDYTTPSTMGDAAFRNWMQTCNSIIETDIDGITTASGNLDLSSLEFWSKELKNDADRYKNQVYSYTVSSVWYPVRTAYYSALDDYYWTGYYGELGARYSNADYISYAADYMSRGTDHLETCLDLIKQMR